MPALPPKADVDHHSGNVRFVPLADIPHCGRDWRYSITSVGGGRKSFRYRKAEGLGGTHQNKVIRSPDLHGREKSRAD
jgi:hypothetical protein